MLLRQKFVYRVIGAQEFSKSQLNFAKMKRNMIFMLSKLMQLLTRKPKFKRDFQDVADQI